MDVNTDGGWGRRGPGGHACWRVCSPPAGLHKCVSRGSGVAVHTRVSWSFARVWRGPRARRGSHACVCPRTRVSGPAITRVSIMRVRGVPRVSAFTFVSGSRVCVAWGLGSRARPSFMSNTECGEAAAAATGGARVCREVTRAHTCPSHVCPEMSAWARRGRRGVHA